MTIVSGEVVHITKCIPLEMSLQHEDYWYSELQVTRENLTYFSSPRTYIFKKKCNKIACNAFIPVYYLVGDTSLKIMPHRLKRKSP